MDGQPKDPYKNDKEIGENGIIDISKHNDIDLKKLKGMVI